MAVPECMLNIEYWGGSHFFDDHCRGIAVNYLPLPLEEEQRLAHFEEIEELGVRRALGILSMENTKTLVPQDSLTKDFFNGEELPEGSIIRIHKEKLWRSKKPDFLNILRWVFMGEIKPSIWEEPTYYDGKYVGVLLDLPSRHCCLERKIVQFMEGSWRGGYNQFGHVINPRIPIGVTKHTVIRDDWFSINDSESLERVIAVDILK